MNKLKEEKKGFRMYELNCLVGLGHTDRIGEIGKKIEAWIEKKKGEIAEIEKSDTPEAKGGKSRIWIEKKRLAYPVRKDNFGYFLYSWLWLNPADVNDLKRFLKLEKEIERSFILERDNASAPAPLKDAVPLDNAAQLEEKRPERKAFYERRPVEPIRPAVPRPRAVIEAVPEPQPEVKPEEKLEMKPEEKKEPVVEEEKVVAKPKKKPVKEETKKEVKEEKEEKPEVKKEEKAAKQKKITLEELDQRLDDILNEDIL